FIFLLFLGDHHFINVSFASSFSFFGVFILSNLSLKGYMMFGVKIFSDEKAFSFKTFQRNHKRIGNSVIRNRIESVEICGGRVFRTIGISDRNLGIRQSLAILGIDNFSGNFFMLCRYMQRNKREQYQKNLQYKCFHSVLVLM